MAGEATLAALLTIKQLKLASEVCMAEEATLAALLTIEQLKLV